ncbi:MAG: thioredoxin family protein [Saprospiraceae bacterium]|jgi:peroxiredoxin|nr:thioredoxin family protein [Saprospiraceae bacterium]
MAFTESSMLPLGTLAPSFTLPDTVSGKNINLQDIQSDKANLIMFICNHCPYVIHVEEELARLAKDYQAKGVNVVAISSNDVERYPADSPDKMTDYAAKNEFTFPYLYDESQAVAKAYDAACTPDFYVFDGEMRLAYRGRLDDSRPNSDTPLTGKDLRAALDAVLAGETVSEVQYPSGGCGIKWK